MRQDARQELHYRYRRMLRGIGALASVFNGLVLIGFLLAWLLHQLRVAQLISSIGIGAVMLVVIGLGIGAWWWWFQNYASPHPSDLELIYRFAFPVLGTIGMVLGCAQFL